MEGGYQKGYVCIGYYDEKRDCVWERANTTEEWSRIAYLPHSCDEWVIGGPEEIRQMIADLQEALATLERKR